MQPGLFSAISFLWNCINAHFPQKMQDQICMQKTILPVNFSSYISTYFFSY